jgi:hypothetical protein
MIGFWADPTFAWIAGFGLLAILAFRALKRKSERELASYEEMCGDVDDVFRSISRVLSDHRTPAGLRRSILVISQIMQTRQNSVRFISFEPKLSAERSAAIDAEFISLQRDHPDLYADSRKAMLGLFVMMATSYLESPLAAAATIHKALQDDVMKEMAERVTSTQSGSGLFGADAIPA